MVVAIDSRMKPRKRLTQAIPHPPGIQIARSPVMAIFEPVFWEKVDPQLLVDQTLISTRSGILVKTIAQKAMDPRKAFHEIG